MIKLTSKRIFYRGLSIFSGGILGGLITKHNFNFITITVPDFNPILLVFVFSSFVRFIVWIAYLRNSKKVI